MNSFIELKDYLLLPIYILIIYIIANRYKNKHYKGTPYEKYFMAGMWVKVGGAVFIGLIYQYYYGNGDTAGYFRHAKIINSSFFDSPNTWWKLITHTADPFNPADAKYIDRLRWYKDEGTFMIARICAVFNIFTFNTFLPTSVLFSFLSYSGVWRLFKTFSTIEPKLLKPFAFACLFIPSLAVWGSGIFKDTITLGALGWLTYSSYFGLIRGEKRIKNYLIIIFCCFLIGIIKVYIIIAFLPALMVWILSKQTEVIQFAPFRIILKTFFLSIVALVVYLLSSVFTEEMGRYSAENIVNTAAVTRDWIAYSSGDEGSAYTLGDFEPSMAGMLSKFPAAVNVALFRPYFWEAGKVVIFFSALESFCILLFTVYAILKTGLFKSVVIILRNPDVQFCLIFSIIFAFAVGISTYNFGSLVRYKIPCLPFFLSGLILLLHKRLKKPKPIEKSYTVTNVETVSVA